MLKSHFLNSYTLYPPLVNYLLRNAILSFHLIYQYGRLLLILYITHLLIYIFNQFDNSSIRNLWENASLAFLWWLNLQVDFSGRLLSIVVPFSGHQFANFSHFRLLKNFWAILKQT